MGKGGVEMGKFNERFRKLKEERNMTAKDLSEELKIPASTLSYYLKDREPGLDAIIAIANYFDVTTDWLIGKCEKRKITKEERISMNEYGVSETCQHCGFDAELAWDTEAYGYNIFCPNCGKEMMLCEMCKHAQDNLKGYCDFRWINKEKTEGICFRRLEQMLKTAYAEKDLNEGKCGK